MGVILIRHPWLLDTKDPQMCRTMLLDILSLSLPNYSIHTINNRSIKLAHSIVMVTSSSKEPTSLQTVVAVVLDDSNKMTRSYKLRGKKPSSFCQSHE